MTPPRIVFVGPMLGRHPGWVPQLMEILSPLLTAEGYTCYLTSSVVNRYVRFIDTLWTLIRLRGKVEIACLQTYSFRSFIIEDAASRLSRLLGYRVVIVMHGGAIPEFMAKNPNWTRRVFNRAHLIITPSQYLARAIEPYGFTSQVIPNLIKLEDYPYQHRQFLQPRLLWMRTFHKLYNPQMAVQALAELRQVRPDTTLTMAGQEKGLLSKVKTLAQELGVSDHIKFVGFLDTTGKQREFARHDIFLNTNHIDNMPISVLEAAAFGLPIVATAIGGVPDLLQNEKTGLLVSDSDVSAMARSVLRLLAEPELASSLSTNGRALAERSAWSAVFPLWQRAFEQVMDSRVSGLPTV